MQLTACEGDEISFHGDNEGLTFTNIMKENNDDGDAAGDGGTHDSGGRSACSSVPDTCRCYNCKKEGHLKPSCLMPKEKWATKEAENAARNGTIKACGCAYGRK